MRLEQLKLSSREKMLSKSKKIRLSPSEMVLKGSSKDISLLKLIFLEEFFLKLKTLILKLMKTFQMRKLNSKEEIDLLKGKTIEGLTIEAKKDSTTLKEETTEIEIQIEPSTTNLVIEISTEIVISIETKTVITIEIKIVITTRTDSTRIVTLIETKIVILTAREERK